MNEDNPKKQYPVASDAVAEMLGLTGKSSESGQASTPLENEKGVLNISEKKSTADQPKELGQSQKISPEPQTVGAFRIAKPGVIKASLPYLTVFIIGLIAYYFFFSNTGFNLSGVFKVNSKITEAPKTVKDSELMVLQKDPKTLERYYAWIAQFYFEATDTGVLDPNADNSGNGLTNFQKFLLNFNPKSYDTLGLGMADSQAIAENISPITGKLLTEGQKQIIEKYFDLEIINNRLAVEQLKRNGLVAGVGINRQGYSSFAAGSLKETPSSNGATGGVQNGQNRAGGYDNLVNPQINSNDLNFQIPGRLEISSHNINVPVIFTKDTRNFEKDLQSGVVHYPGTAMPGQIGTVYISGHSSNYLWAKGDYNQVFAKLGDLPDNSSFTITVVQNNGKDAKFHYVVTGRKIYSPTDQAQFSNTGESLVALSTCWPVGSTKSRMVVFGKLTQVEK